LGDERSQRAVIFAQEVENLFGLGGYPQLKVAKLYDRGKSIGGEAAKHLSGR